MLRTVVVVGTLLLGVGVVAAQQDQVNKTQLAMKSNLKSALALLDMVKGKQPYDQAAVNASWPSLRTSASVFRRCFRTASKA